MLPGLLRFSAATFGPVREMPTVEMFCRKMVSDSAHE
jgi:hypothetical protein